MTCLCTWNPADKHASFDLSNADLTATKTSTVHGIVRATHPKNTGKLYFEFYLDYRFSNIRYGIATAAALLSQQLGMNQWSWCKTGTAYAYHNSAWKDATGGLATGNTGMVAVNLDNGKVWFGVNNIWSNSGNPAGDANEMYQDNDIMNYDIYIAASAYDDTTIFSLKACDTDFIYTPPSGFVAWLVAPSGKLLGTIKEKGVAKIRTVRCYTRSTGVLFDSTVSAANGTFELSAPDDSTEMFVVAFDDDLGDQYNALIYDRVVGVVV